MSTIGYQLNILRDTQMVQRRLLEKQFPYIDWARMPFSSYGDFFRLRGIIDDCGAVWTNAYGRSNSEAEDTRKYLRDYSGNGRDIELFNFGYSKQSGFNGYVQDFRNWSKTDSTATIDISEDTIEISGNTEGWVVALWNVATKNTYVNKQWTIDLHIISSNSSYISLFFFDNNSSQYKSIQLTEGRNVIQPLTGEEYAKTNFIRINCNAESHVVITQIAPYRGAIVGDGVDDYGRCIKDFALPDDYTVVAMREFIDHKAPLITKSIMDGNMSFIFEHIDGVYSYGNYNNVTFPNLFSYMSKSTYNGQNISAGNTTDSTEIKLRVFNEQNSNLYESAALYSFGIFTRTLTDEELRIVENCMYAEWIAMTGKLEDIEYYDILDARFRSNEESEDKRNKWVGRLGKLHMTLHNYAYSEMSGWNGMRKWLYGSDQSDKINECTYNIKQIGISVQLYDTATPGQEIKLHFRIKNVPQNVLVEIIDAHGGSYRTKLYQWISDGQEKEINTTVTVTSEDANQIAIFVHNRENSIVDISSNPIQVTFIPDYGGALVQDGVDDYAVSDEVIDEPIGGVVAHAEILPSNTGYIFSTNWKSDGIFEYSSLAYRIAGDIVSGNEQVDTKNESLDTVITAFGRVPAIPAGKLFIGTINETLQQMGNTALYQLRLIKTQPTDTQLEAIKWQCRKEHEDYLDHMGWKDDSPAWYGVEWDVTDPSPDVKRIGNMQMHRDLPVQSQMRGCLIDDNGVVQKYLNPDDWTSETLDGSAGQVMVQAPVDSYWRFEKDGNIRRVKFSTIALPGFKRTPQGFISAHEATVQRSTNKLCSVVNTDPDYRGGSNKAEWDGTYRSLLGMPATSISRTSFRTYARNRKQSSTEWNCMTYDFQKLLYWLFVVEYATLNTQKPVNTEKDANGFSQGGLGNGVTTWDWTAWSNHNSNYPFIPCGVTNKLGNNSGEVAFQITLSDNSTREFKVARYRGVENPFGHVWQWTDGLNLRISANTSAGGDGLSRIFTCSDPAKFSDTGYDGYKYIGDAPRAEGYMKDIVFGEDGDIVPISTGGSTTTYFCDYWYTSIPDSGESLRGVLFGGSADYWADAGLACAGSSGAPSSASAHFGSRLCFIPA